MLVKVECYAGYRGEQEPQRIVFDGRRVEVVDILDAWLATDHRYFKLKGDDGAIYILRHDTQADIWELTMLERRMGGGKS